MTKPVRNETSTRQQEGGVAEQIFTGCRPSPAAAWPVLIDEFVEYARDKLNIPKPEPPEEADDDIF